MVSLPFILASRRQRIHVLAQVRTASRGRNSFANIAGIGQQSNAVAREERHLAQSKCGVGRMIEFAERCNFGPHQPSCVEDDPDSLAFFQLVESCNELAATRGGTPANVGEVVAILIFAQAFEGTPSAANPAEAFFQRDLPA